MLTLFNEGGKEMKHVEMKRIEKKRVLFVHCAGPQDSQQGSQSLLTYLEAELGEEYVFTKPILSDPDNPTYENWKRVLDEAFKTLQTQPLTLIGHSLGGAVLLKYLAENELHVSIERLLLLAPPYWGVDEDWNNNSYQLQENYVDHLPSISKIYIYHSKQDSVVPYVHFEKYLQDLSGATGRVLDGETHYFKEGLPVLVDDLGKID